MDAPVKEAACPQCEWRVPAESLADGHKKASEHAAGCKASRQEHRH